MPREQENSETSEKEAARLLRGQEVEAADKRTWKSIAAAIERCIAKVENYFNLVGAILILVVGFLTVSDVIGRYFFRSPIFGTVDITEILMAGIVFLGLAYTLRAGAHIKVDLFVSMLKGRAYHLMEFSTLFLSLFLFGIIFVTSLQITLKSWTMGGVTPQLWWPVWPAKLCLTIGAFLISLRLIVQLIQHLSQVKVGIERRSL